MSRYIDADALNYEMKQRKKSAYQWYLDAEVKEDEEIMVRADSAMVAFIECILTIDQQPTADVAPVRKGKWILVKGSNGKDYHKCSYCLHTQEITGVKNYCSVCGARMEGAES